MSHCSEFSFPDPHTKRAFQVSIAFDYFSLFVCIVFFFFVLVIFVVSFDFAFVFLDLDCGICE